MNLGVDIIEIARVNTALMRSGDRLSQRLLTPLEQQALGDLAENVERLAGFWAAKEAAAKALGTGFRLGILFHDIEIRHDELGCPYYFFSGEFARLMQEKKLTRATLSISHCQSHAIAAAALG
ncbi:holo-ACP synthase [Serratia sp. T13T92]|jgi:holo-[acyl-carrier protein] synthase|uniref:holo-ACP synthase n=1 Tax=Serratia TaxID=613 RepID=UPI00192C6614|nr:holo-ACP synthase [Serratia fonticola]MBL5861234.1 holo-ACP synthase [Serratia fonticola]